jgi:hypothetical protein
MGPNSAVSVDVRYLIVTAPFGRKSTFNSVASGRHRECDGARPGVDPARGDDETTS